MNKPVKTGSRDAAIWLTAVEYAREHPDETVYFVSKNTNDFGDGSSYKGRARLWRDIQELGDRFKHYASLDPVVAEFTQPTEVDDALVQEQVGTPEAASIIARKREPSGVPTWRTCTRSTHPPSWEHSGPTRKTANAPLWAVLVPGLRRPTPRWTSSAM